MIIMCLSYHLGIGLAPETAMLIYRQFYDAWAHTSKPMVFHENLAYE